MNTDNDRGGIDDRWRRVESLYHEMLARPAYERASALVAACSGDPALAAEVQSLLDQPESAAGFLATPALDVAARLVSGASSTLTGRRIGVFEVQGLLGVGGMGEVYRARDTRLARTVAIKILPRAFKDDPERLARFEREARVLASLNHPNIGAVYGLEDAGDFKALVLELVEGEDLSQRIARGAIPIDEALPIARQVAEAIEAAHEQGVIHRDLKPANIKVRVDGTVKVLDFGLAKAMERTEAAGTDPTESPTLTARATQTGMIIGTAAYMAPEQARGKAVDRRADIWSFGVVLYEMLSGERAFKGDDAAATLAAVLRDTPPLDTLPALVPPRIKRLLERCLDRDPKTRLRDIGEARVEIARIEAGALDATAVSRVPTVGPRWLTGRVLTWALVVGFGVAALMGAGVTQWALWRPAPEPATPVRLSVELGADASLATFFGSGFGAVAILSPDGKLLAFTAQKAAGQQPQLYVRRLEQLAASALSGTEDASNPFFSPDSQWLGFVAEGKLKKVAVTGGATVTLCDAPDDRGGTWSEDGTILFTPRGTGGLSRVSSAGGTPEVLTTPDEAAGENSHRWPQALPGGKAVLFTAGAVGDFEGASIVVQSLPKGPSKVLQRGGYHGRYLKSGHIVYIHQGTLFGAPFDRDRLELTGPPAPVLEGVAASPSTGASQFDFSDRGTLVFLRGQSAGTGVPIQWMDKDGKTEPLRALVGNYNNIRFSPDGQRLALDLREGREGVDVWAYEWGRDTMFRLTFDPGRDGWPVWTPDGQRITFGSTRALTANIYWQRADGTGEAERLTESKNPQFPGSWHPSGKFLAFNESGPQTGQDIMILPMEGDEALGWKPGKPTAFLNSPFLELEPAFSPDGKWLAYRSDESGHRGRPVSLEGRSEVYVRPFPGPGGKWQVSTGGGSFPTWSRNRKELFYRTPEQTLMVAPYAAEGDSFRAEKPRQWSPGLVPRAGGGRAFDLHPDGQRMAVLRAAEQQAEEKRDHVVFIENFFDELRRAAPPSRVR